jgi:hypothetical protein
MGCPHLFVSPHPTSDRLDAEEVDAMHDAMVATESRLIDEIVRGAGDDYGRRSMLPATRSVPVHWLAEIDEENEIMRYAIED